MSAPTASTMDPKKLAEAVLGLFGALLFLVGMFGLGWALQGVLLRLGLHGAEASGLACALTCITLGVALTRRLKRVSSSS